VPNHRLPNHTRLGQSLSDPELNFEINAAVTFNMLRARACRATGISKMIFGSTGGAIVGEQETPVHEGMVPRPILPYKIGKLASEAYSSAYTGAYGMKTAVLDS
jgi:UDP-glucose 4-epimerase